MRQEGARDHKRVTLLLIASAVLAYYNSLHAPFLFDDGRTILDNPHLRHWWPVWEPMAGTTRPLVLWTLAINYAAGGLRVWGYHLVNVAIHLAAGLTLYGLIRRTLLLPSAGRFAPSRATNLAGVSSLLWLVHPLQTESVTYIIQRAESLMGLCYLVTLYCVVRGATVATSAARNWYADTVLVCALGMASKPVMVTAPLMVLLYDRTFLARSWRAAWQQRRGLYLGLASTWVILLACVLTAPEDYGTTAGLNTPVPWWQYAATQPGVLLHYLRLALWPHPLLLDYAWPWARTWRGILPPLLVIGTLLGLTVWALRSRPALGFLGIWFFGVLAPTSSFLPISDPIFEHRMYLPLAAVVILTVLGVEAILRRYPVATHRTPGALGLSIAAAAMFSLATIRRNAAYVHVVPLWSGIVALQPTNARAHGNLGYTYETQGRLDEAIKEYAAVLALSPEDPVAHNNLGTTLVKQGKLQEAANHFQEAVRLNPNYAPAHLWLGLVRIMQDEPDSATSHLAAALWLDPANAELTMERLRSIAVPRGRYEEIVERLQKTFSAEAR